MKPVHIVLQLLVAALLLPGRALAEDAGALADRLLQAVGGRAAWAETRRLLNRSQQNRVDEPTVVVATIRIDFQQPRVRIDTEAPGLKLVRVLDGDAHWRLARSGAIGPVPEATLAEDRRWYAAHVYRTLHRVAARDAALSLRSPRAGRLEVVEGGRRLLWFALDARGEPYAFGAHDDEQGTISGPWLPMPGVAIRHPAWTASADGSWRALVQHVEVNPVFYDDSFRRPAAP